MEITIVLQLFEDNERAFGFERSVQPDHYSSGGACPRCNYIHLNVEYTKIIKQLKEAGLVCDNYKPLCCDCYNEKRG